MLYYMIELRDSIVPKPCRGKGGASTCERTHWGALMVLPIIWWSHYHSAPGQRKRPHTASTQLLSLQDGYLSPDSCRNTKVDHPYFKVSHETCRVMAPCGATTLPVCFVTRDQLATTLFTHEHRVCFDFVIDVQFPTDIHYHLLDCTGKRPGIPARIVRRDWLSTIAPHV
jgi:hypothetical protein